MPALPPLDAADHLRGDADAPLVIFYGDYTCPRCAVAHERLRDAPLRVAFRHFALPGRHPRAVPLACAAEAAARQGRFWEFHDALFGDQGRLDDPHLWARARELGLDLERFERDRRDGALAELVKGQTRAGIRAGVTATPTLFAGDEVVAGAPDAGLIARMSR